MDRDILEWLNQELALYEDLKQRAGEQLERIEAGDVPGFREASKRREEIQERISAVEARIGPELKRVPDQGLASRAREIRGRIRAVALETQETDRATSAAAQDRRARAAERMGRLKKGRRGVRGYVATRAPRSPKFLDRQG